MSKAYWLTLKITAGNDPKITHNESIILKVCFDENAIKKDEKQYRYDAEFSGIELLKKEGLQRFDFEITEAEYNAGYFKVHIWGEPYGYVAFRKKGTSYDLAVGRLSLEPENCKKGVLLDRPPNAKDGDLQILCELEIVQSVVNYMTDELNNNKNGSYAGEIKKRLDYANELDRKFSSDDNFSSVFEEVEDPPPPNNNPMYFTTTFMRGISYRNYACLVHSNSSQYQEIGYCFPFNRNGGIWDHKPKIAKKWGERNRLGNREIVYYYDIWSNIHYGFIGKKIGFSDKTLLREADRAQRYDNKGAEKDDSVDQEAILEGINLSNKEEICIDDLINIIEKHPDWDYDIRFPGVIKK